MAFRIFHEVWHVLSVRRVSSLGKRGLESGTQRDLKRTVSKEDAKKLEDWVRQRVEAVKAEMVTAGAAPRPGVNMALSPCCLAPTWSPPAVTPLFAFLIHDSV